MKEEKRGVESNSPYLASKSIAAQFQPKQAEHFASTAQHAANVSPDDNDRSENIQINFPPS